MTARSPRVRRDGLCAQPGCRKSLGRTIPKTRPALGYATLKAMLATDPFCSSPCAKKWYGVDGAETSGLERAQTTRATAEYEHDLEAGVA